MPADDTAELPDVAALIAAALQRVAPEHQPLLVAVAERLAAHRYRGWAAEPEIRTVASQLLACATREEEIAGRVEALHPGAAAIQGDLLRANPELEDLNRTVFAGRPLRQQLTIQARGERLGAVLWRALAKRDARAEVRQTLLRCAELEEESAGVLEAICQASPPIIP
jgi:hypothetical protein